MNRLRGLVGHTGLIGSTLARSDPFDRTWNRSNIGTLGVEALDELIVSGAPAGKWQADADPDGDLANLTVLAGAVAGTKARRVMLISTVDVFPDPNGVTEDDEPARGHRAAGYGANRLWLEDQVRAAHPDCLVVRLPAVFGPGLKKNLLFDLVNDRPEFANRDSMFQFYPLHRLAGDLRLAWDARLRLAHLTVEPVSAADIARVVFGRALTNTSARRTDYDLRTRHADVFGGPPGGPYLLDRAAVLRHVRAFIEEQRAWLSPALP